MTWIKLKTAARMVLAALEVWCLGKEAEGFALRVAVYDTTVKLHYILYGFLLSEEEKGTGKYL